MLSTKHDSNTDNAPNPIHCLHRHVLRKRTLHNSNFYRRFGTNMQLCRFSML